MDIPEIDEIALDDEDTDRLKVVVSDADPREAREQKSLVTTDTEVPTRDDEPEEMLAPELVFPEGRED